MGISVDKRAALKRLNIKKDIFQRNNCKTSIHVKNIWYTKEYAMSDLNIYRERVFFIHLLMREI